MPVLLHWEHAPLLRIRDTGSPAPPLLSGSAAHNVRWGSDGKPDGNTSDADCSKVPCRFRRYCGFPGCRDADAMPALPEHRGLHPPGLSPRQSYVFWCRWTEIPDNVWSPPHRGRPAPVRIFPSRILRRSPRFCVREHPHRYFSGYEPLHLLP